MPRKSTPCAHSTICTSPSPTTPFQRPTPRQRRAAATWTRRLECGSTPGDEAEADDEEDDGIRARVFPGPLALPDELLTIDPDQLPQDVKGWLDTATRVVGNRVTRRRNALYIIPPPEGADEHGMHGWDEPSVPPEYVVAGVKGGSQQQQQQQQQPSVQDLGDYLSAFYHPMPVKPHHGFHWAAWPQSKRAKIPRIGLATPAGQVYGIRHRAGPDGVATQQLNLNDITDAMMGCIPKDAHAAVMVVPWDLYEDDDDDFCCGRAYGGSRVCIVSSFRYRPCLDRYEGIDLAHMWPASHCGAYVDRLSKVRGARRSRSEPIHGESAMGLAIHAATPVLVPQTEDDYNGLWYSRVARTLSHEVGHCFTMGHCVYYACVMQGTAGMAEDVRQPPYLCPVCLKKVAYNMRALTEATDHAERAWVQGHYEALRDVACKWRHVGMFAGWEAWLNMVLDEMSGPVATISVSNQVKEEKEEKEDGKRRRIS